MIFQGKIDRAFKWLKDKNKATDIDVENNIVDKQDQDMCKDHEEDIQNKKDLKLEKKDYLAIFISSIAVFAPIILILLIIAIWAFI